MTPEQEAAERMRLRIYRAPLTGNAYYAFVLAILVVGIAALLVATWPRPERKVSDWQAAGSQAAVELSGDVSALRGELPPAASQAVAAPAPDAVPGLPRRPEPVEGDCRALGFAFIARPPCVPWIFDLNQPALPVPQAFAEGAVRIFLGCEVRGVIQTPYGLPWAAVGAAGERGAAQLHPIHDPAIVKFGLDPLDEGDRLRFAAIKWQRDGENFDAWSCAAR